MRARATKAPLGAPPDRRAHRCHVDDLRQASPAPARQWNTSDRLPHLTPPPPKPPRAKIRLANGLAFWGGSDLTAPTPSQRGLDAGCLVPTVLLNHAEQYITPLKHL